MFFYQKMFYCWEMYLRPFEILSQSTKIRSSNFLRSTWINTASLIKEDTCELCLDKFRLELLKYVELLLVFEKGIRDGTIEVVRL